MGLTWNVAGPTVYTEVSGTFTFNDDDVKFLYVDWGDGEDNSLEKAIYQWKELDTDSSSVTLSHTYTKADTFAPVMRTINSKGYLSKYLYRTGTVTDLPEPNETVSNITTLAVNDGNATGVMRIENKEVLSGVDNDIFYEGPKDVYVMVAPLIPSSSAVITVPATVDIEVDVVLDLVTYNDQLPASTFDDVGLGTERVVRTISQSISLNDSTPTAPETVQLNVTGGMIREILEVRFVTPKLLKTAVFTNSNINEFNKLKIFLMAKANDGFWYPITYVSNGDPIKCANDPKRKVTLDFSQSRAKASNKSIDYYRYDDGKVWFEPTHQWQAMGSVNRNKFSSDTTNGQAKTNNPIVKEEYTYYTQPNGLLGSVWSGAESTTAITSGNAWSYGTAENETYQYVRDQFVLNEFNQFYNQNHITRVEAVAKSSKSSYTGIFQNVYRIRPVLAPYEEAGYYISPASVSTTDQSSIQTSGAYLNGSGNAINTTNWNVGTFVYQDNSTPREASNYFVITNGQQFDRVFINLSTNSPEMESNLQYNSGSTIAGVYYLKVSNGIYGDKFTQKAEWKPLAFEDTTKIEKEYRDSDNSKYVTKSNTMSRSGFIKFDIPPDWSTVPTISGLTGGLFGLSGQTVDVSQVSTDYSKSVTATYSGSLNTSFVFDNFVLSGCTGLSDYIPDDIGKYECVFQIVTADTSTDDDKVFWVASGGADASDADTTAPTKLFLSNGDGSTLDTSVGDQMTGYIRRVNIYDVFDGASKTSDIGDTPNYDDTPTFTYPYEFQVGNSADFVNDFKNNFNGYPLKIVVSGAANHFTSGTAGSIGMSIWNMFPTSGANSQVIVQKDNSAYDLTYLEITSDVSVSYASTYYQAISKNGKVFISRTGTPIQSISFGGSALGDDTQFKFSADYTSYGTLRLLRRMQSESVRVMWDEVQKDGTFVRYFGFITGVSETHSVAGPRAPRPFTFTMVIEEICLLTAAGRLMSGIVPLGGLKDATNYQ